MSNTGYNLHKDLYDYRYFWPNPDLPGLLKDVRRFVKGEGIVVDNITINNWWDPNVEAVVFEATVCYEARGS